MVVSRNLAYLVCCLLIYFLFLGFLGSYIYSFAFCKLYIFSGISWNWFF